MYDVIEIEGQFEWRIYDMRLLPPIAVEAVGNCEL
jgi:hypothetical protein